MRRRGVSRGATEPRRGGVSSLRLGTIFANVRAPKTERRGDDRARPFARLFKEGVRPLSDKVRECGRVLITACRGVDAAIGRGRSRGSRSRAPRRSKKHARCARWLIPKADNSSLRGDAPGWRSPRHPAGGPVIREAAVGRDESGESRVPRSIEGRARGGRRKVFDFPGGREDSPQRHSVSACGSDGNRAVPRDATDTHLGHVRVLDDSLTLRHLE